MAERKNKFLIKRSNVAGKVPTAGDLLLGEMALNTADVILYASGTTANSILPIGWDRVNLTGDTMTGTLYTPSVSATTMSAVTYYGDGSNLTGIPTANTYTTTAYTVGNTVVYDNTEASSAYTVDLSGLSNLPTDEQFQLFGNQSSTGLIEYGGLSANTLDNTKFDVGPMKGWIVDNTTNPESPVVTYIDYSGSTGSNPSGVTLTYLATNPVTYIGLSGDTTGDIVQSTTPFDASDHRDSLQLGVVIHSDNTQVNVTNNLPGMGIDPTSQFYDLIHALGYFNLDLAGEQGNIYSYNGSNLNIDKTGGDIFAHGSNYTNDPKNPHIKTLSSGDTLTFRYRISDSTEWANTTEINPNIYETGGSTAATPTNKFTAQRINMFPSGISRLQYGQNVYDSIDDAEGALSTESFIVEGNIKDNALLRGFVITKEGATDLSDPTQGKFVIANHFGHANDTVVGDVHRTEIVNSSSTGLRLGGEMTINGDNTKFDISSGSGVIVDNYTTPNNPTLIQVDWGTLTGLTVTNLTGDTGSYVFLKSDGTVKQEPISNGVTEADYRDFIYLGLIGHASQLFINNVFNTPLQLVSPINQHQDLASAIGPFSVNGNIITNIVGSLELKKDVGKSFLYGGNFHNDAKAPSQLNTGSLSGDTLFYATGLKVLGPSGTTVDTDNFDPDGLGVVVPIAGPSTQYVAHRLWHQPSSNLLIFQYGQVGYANQATCRDSFETENYIVPSGIEDVAYVVAILITKDGDANLDNALIIPQGKFAGTGGGGTSPDTLQSAYNNSTNPEIITDVSRGALDLVVGSGSDSDNLMTFQSSGKTINAFVTGEGNATFSGQVDTNTARLISTPTQDNTGTDILVRNITTGVIEYRQASTFSGATDTNYYVTGGTVTTGGTLTLTRNDAVNVGIDFKETKRMMIGTDSANAISAGVAYLGDTGASFLSFGGTGVSDDEASFNFVVPTNYISGGTFYLKFTTTATGNDVQFEMNITSIDNGGDLSTATDTAIQNATTGAGTSWDMIETAAYAPVTATFSADKNVVIKINRDASDAPDTFNNTAYVWGLVFEYTGIK
jgi:hypothetical protein